MHEVSIAMALAEQVRQHRPAGQRVQKVAIEAGAMQAVEPDAMAMAWQSVVMGTDLAGAELELTRLPYRMNCPACGRSWESEDMFEVCACGSETTLPTGSDVLRLVSLEVEEASTRRETADER
jgi:hydrogenase nickel incorporation protein HypA/HybF